MGKSVNEVLERDLNEIEGKKLTIIQEGFIENKYEIEKAKCGIELDVLSIEDDNGFIRINLNLVNKVLKNENGIEFYLDNDTKIIIK